ncbi:sensor domain-containing diguanylate cyclase [Thiomicrorhabdus indica]|uniref:sensor domain-containing diguanylate cyclase n=1 Tax=Thiomicrorhabdus indica TaxID=2267253 RepID=UPI00102DD1EC|nr:sensor domain-containing diguanylate cyclase [Thiomicrorhabdus indica]
MPSTPQVKNQKTYSKFKRFWSDFLPTSLKSPHSLSSKNDNSHRNFSIHEAPKLSVSILVICGILLLGVLWNAQNSVTQIKLHAQKAYQSKLKSEIDNLVTEKRQIFMGLAHALSKTSDVQNLLCKECPKRRVDLKPLIASLSVSINYPDLWVQVLDSNGVSRYRSWTEVKNDNLLKVRRDLRDFYEDLQPASSVSVGKFTLSMKSTVPIYDDQGAFIGALEVIAPFDPMAKLLPNENSQVYLFADKSLRSKLVRADAEGFINGYYLLNRDIEPQQQRFLSLNIESLVKAEEQSFNGEDQWLSQPITNDFNRVLGFWLVHYDQSVLFTDEINTLLKQTVYNAGALLFMLLMFLMVYGFKFRAEKRHYYYRQIFNSASDILFVTDGETVFEANNHFFGFFKDIRTLDEFNRSHRSIYTQFVPEPDVLHFEKEGQFWLDYIENHPDEQHKVKIMKDDSECYFSVRAVRINQKEPLYVVALQDISKQIEYQNEIIKVANTDALTGIGNRLSFDRQLKSEVKRAHRYEAPLSLIVFDIDAFKDVNIEYGHGAADDVLRWMSQSVGAMLRESDVLCRCGGEEFALIMPETELDNAAKKAEKIRIMIRSQFSPVEGLHMTVSFGVAELSIWDNPDTLLTRADNALYKAKQDGRDQVVKGYHEMLQNSQTLKENFSRYLSS